MRFEPIAKPKRTLGVGLLERVSDDRRIEVISADLVSGTWLDGARLALGYPPQRESPYIFVVARTEDTQSAFALADAMETVMSADDRVRVLRMSKGSVLYVAIGEFVSPTRGFYDLYRYKERMLDFVESDRDVLTEAERRAVEFALEYGWSYDARTLFP